MLVRWRVEQHKDIAALSGHVLACFGALLQISRHELFPPSTPQRIAPTSTEINKQYKQRRLCLSDRQRKQLERDFNSDQRAARAREAGKPPRRSARERLRRQRRGSRLELDLRHSLLDTAIPMSGGSTAFLGVKKRKEQEKRKKESELTKRDGGYCGEDGEGALGRGRLCCGDRSARAIR
jgi:hypothetical protein